MPFSIVYSVFSCVVGKLLSLHNNNSLQIMGPEQQLDSKSNVDPGCSKKKLACNEIGETQRVLFNEELNAFVTSKATVLKVTGLTKYDKLYLSAAAKRMGFKCFIDCNNYLVVRKNVFKSSDAEDRIMKSGKSSGKFGFMLHLDVNASKANKKRKINAAFTATPYKRLNETPSRLNLQKIEKKLARSEARFRNATEQHVEGSGKENKLTFPKDACIIDNVYIKTLSEIKGLYLSRDVASSSHNNISSVQTAGLSSSRVLTNPPKLQYNHGIMVPKTYNQASIAPHSNIQHFGNRYTQEGFAVTPEFLRVPLEVLLKTSSLCIQRYKSAIELFDQQKIRALDRQLTAFARIDATLLYFPYPNSTLYEIGYLTIMAKTMGYPPVATNDNNFYIVKPNHIITTENDDFCAKLIESIADMRRLKHNESLASTGAIRKTTRQEPISYNRLSMATPARIATPSRNETPARIATPTMNATLARIATPTMNATLARIATPTMNTTPARIATPTMNATLARIATPTMNTTPARIATPTRIETPTRNAKPDNRIKRIQLEQQLQALESGNEWELKLYGTEPNERFIVKNLCQQFGFTCHYASKVFTVTKPQKCYVLDHSDCLLRLDNFTWPKLYMANYDEYLHFRKEDLVHLHNTCKANIAAIQQMSGNPYGRWLPLPGPILSNRLQSVRDKLPIAKYRSMLLEAIASNQVLVVAGETGSGKTTQVAQYILEEFHMQRQPCRIICTQPRRLAATSIAERIAAERGDYVGRGVGYQIRLDSCVTDSTNLIVTTAGYFTQCLLGGSVDKVLPKITHLILDEVHERDSHVDFLMITIRDALPRHPHLKVVLMSATMDTDIFGKYFFNCPVIQIPGRMYDVKKFYLEDVLQLVQYPICKSVTVPAPIVKLNPQNQADMDRILHNCFLDSEEFEDFYALVRERNLPVDTHHSETEMTGLLIAVYHGDCSIIESLLLLGADVTCVGRGKNALQMAEFMGHDEAIDILKHHWDRKHEDDHLEYDQRMRLRSYKASTIADIKSVDLDLVLKLITYIHTKEKDGSILVFLTGYTEIMDLHQLLEKSPDANTFKLHMLHSCIQNEDHREVFQPAYGGLRKIILSTNIAETSLTIDDVVYVIDAGKVKQKTFDAVTGTTCLMATWISKACAEQRAGRAGRTQPGVCYRLFTEKLFDRDMEMYTVPEMLRIPLTELCLQAKRLAPYESIADFLAKAIQPPPAISVDHSIQLLKTMEALTPDECLTHLGFRLSGIALDPQMGKSLLYSIMFGCMDPVLTIVSALSVQDPFVLPALPRDKKLLSDVRREIAGDYFSDHYTLLRIYQMYNQAQATNTERQWCKKNFISYGNMVTIDGVRSHLLLRLKANKLISNVSNEFNRQANNWPLVKMCLAAGLYPNVCRVNKSNVSFQTNCNLRLRATRHSSFCPDTWKDFHEKISNCPVPWVVFYEKSKVRNQFFVKQNTAITTLSLGLIAGSIMDGIYDQNISCYGPNSALRLNNWIEVRGNGIHIAHINQLRLNINLHFMRFVSAPMKYSNFAIWSKLAENVGSLLYFNELTHGMQQPVNVGLAPISYRSYAGIEDEMAKQSSSSFYENFSMFDPQLAEQQLFSPIEGLGGSANRLGIQSASHAFNDILAQQSTSRLPNTNNVGHPSYAFDDLLGQPSTSSNTDSAGHPFLPDPQSFSERELETFENDFAPFPNASNDPFDINLLNLQICSENELENSENDLNPPESSSNATCSDIKQFGSDPFSPENNSKKELESSETDVAPVPSTSSVGYSDINSVGDLFLTKLQIYSKKELESCENDVAPLANSSTASSSDINHVAGDPLLVDHQIYSKKEENNFVPASSTSRVSCSDINNVGDPFFSDFHIYSKEELESCKNEVAPLVNSSTAICSDIKHVAGDPLDLQIYSRKKPESCENDIAPVKNTSNVGCSDIMGDPFFPDFHIYSNEELDSCKNEVPASLNASCSDINNVGHPFLPDLQFFSKKELESCDDVTSDCQSETLILNREDVPEMRSSSPQIQNALIESQKD